MTPTQLIEVMLCCNEPNSGNFSGYLTGFNVGELEMYCTLADEGCWMLFDGNYLRVNGAQFYIADHARWAGNWCWDMVSMPAESACRLLNWARKNNFDLEACPVDFEPVFEDTRPIQIEHLALLF